MRAFESLVRESRGSSDQEPTAYRASQIRALNDAAIEDLQRALSSVIPGIRRSRRGLMRPFDLAAESRGVAELGVEVRVLQMPSSAERRPSLIPFSIRRTIEVWTLRALEVHRASPETVLVGFIFVPLRSFADALRGAERVHQFGSRSSADDLPEHFEEVFYALYD